MAKILVVEDDPLLTKMFQTLIEGQGHQVILADNGEDGMKVARKEQPVMIFMDIMLPKFNGLQSLDVLKADPKTKQIPIVVMTNLAEVNDPNSVIARGAYKYIDKSQYDPKQMVAVMNEVLGTQVAAQPAQTAQPQQQVQETPVPAPVAQLEVPAASQAGQAQVQPAPEPAAQPAVASAPQQAGQETQ